MEIIIVLTGFLAFVLAAADTWTEQIERYKPKTLLAKNSKAFAELSDNNNEQEHFEKTLDLLLIERQPDTKGSRQVQKVIKEYMNVYNWAVEEDKFDDDTPLGNKAFTNIIATQDPRAKRKLVLACHFDSKYFKDIKFVGATDSAVPCTMMLQLARLLHDSLRKKSENDLIEPEITLQFMFFDGEEAYKRWTATDSLYGSRHYAEKLEKEIVQVGREEYVNALKTIDVMILLDLIGTPTTVFRNWFSNTAKLYERFQKIEDRLLRDNLLKERSKSQKYFQGKTGGGGIEDDHIPFMQRGVRILHLISYPFPYEWHKESDNKNALDFVTIDNIGKILRVFVAEYLHLKPPKTL